VNGDGHGPRARGGADVDFIARLADCWNGRGQHPMLEREKRALLLLAHLPDTAFDLQWSALGGVTRERLVFACRQAVDLGDVAAWCFGAGR
jgi:hypothetical protein